MNYLVWWLRQSDYDKTLYDILHKGIRPVEIPKTVWLDIYGREGRPGRCRIWGRYVKDFNELPVHYTNETAWNEFKELLGNGPENDAGGILIPLESGNFCAKLCGIVTTPELKLFVVS